MAQPIKVGFCVAYDWPMLRHALPPVYGHADVIYISLDNERKTWTGKYYAFDVDAFHEFIKGIDIDNKIKVYEDNFHLPELSAGQNEVRQRNMLAEQMGAGGWHIQLDCDEYFLRFSDFVSYLRSLSFKDPRYSVCCPLVTIFKEVENGFLYVRPGTAERSEYIQIASQIPQYQYGRRNGQFNVYTNFLIIHQSWARSEAEIRQKISNWGHNKDFSPDAFLDMWNRIDGDNYTTLINFHPIVPTVWPALQFYPATTMEDLVKSFQSSDFPKLSYWQLRIRNSRFLSRLKKILKRILQK